VSGSQRPDPGILPRLSGYRCASGRNRGASAMLLLAEPGSRSPKRGITTFTRPRSDSESFRVAPAWSGGEFPQDPLQLGIGNLREISFDSGGNGTTWRHLG